MGHPNFPIIFIDFPWCLGFIDPLIQSLNFQFHPISLIQLFSLSWPLLTHWISQIWPVSDGQQRLGLDQVHSKELSAAEASGPEMGIHRVLEKSWEKPWKTHGTSSDLQGKLGRKEMKKPIIWRYLKDPIGRSSSCDMLWLQKTAEVTPCHTNLAKRMLSRTELRAPTYCKSHTNNLPQRNSDDLLINDWSSIFSKAGNHHANASYTIEKQVGCWIVCVYAVKMMMNFRIATAMTMIMIILNYFLFYFNGDVMSGCH